MLQIFSTSLSIVMSAFTIFSESRGLKENFLEYAMLSVKAKQDWVPFGNSLKNNEVKQDLDYSMIVYKLRYVTDMLGHYLIMEYQFTEQSLCKLSAQLLKAHTSKKKSSDIGDSSTQQT